MKQLSELKDKLEDATRKYLELEIQSTRRKHEEDDDSGK